MEQMDGIEIITCEDAVQWESWLAKHYELKTGVWTRIAKKGSAKTSMTITEALDVALCYGWIDSIRKSYDEAYYLQKYSPRRPKGHWSKVNIDKVEALLAAGRMQPPGLAEVEAAKADGRWGAAYESQAKATVPADLEAALQQNPPAKEFFDQLGKTDRYLVILQLLKTRTAETRAARLSKMIAQLEAGMKVT